MVLSVFTRHTPGCKFKHNRLSRRCSCPKWVAGQINKKYFRQSASTRIWEEAEAVRARLEEALEKGLPPFGPSPGLADSSPQPLALSSTPTPAVTVGSKSLLPEVVAPAAASIDPGANRKPRVSIAKAVGAYLDDAWSRSLKPDTMSKLERIFKKQLLTWAKAEGLEYLDELDLDALLSFRTTWHEDAIVRAKKQERVIGFFWVCFRRNYISQNPALGLTKIKTRQVPTESAEALENPKTTFGFRVIA